MWHIELAAPVVHIRYIKATPSRIWLLLNLSINEIEKILYYVKYVVTAVDEELKKNVISQLDKDYHNKIDELDRIYDKEKKATKEATKDKKEKEKILQEDQLRKVYEENKMMLEKEYSRVKSILSNFDVWATILESDYRNIFYRYEGAFTFSSWSQAVLTLLKQINIQDDISSILETFSTLKWETRKKMFKKLKLLINLYISWVKPEWMVLTHLPVIPPDLRPVVQLEWWKFASSDVNLFYRRVLMRNLRLKKMIQVWMPDVVKKNEIRLLQESVNNLLVWEKWNGAWWSSWKVFKSLTDMLSGKEGIFRKNLLWKRVDYSWRSVITIWPGLKLDECWLPLYLAKKMFTPFIIGKLIERKISHTPKQAEKLIRDEDPITLKILEEVIQDKYVLLNRAPTLHRLSIQAFKIKLMPGKTIRIHPLVTPAFNADFDGDQMAVHLPLSEEAQREAKELIASDQNVLKPSSWEPVISHSQDLVVWAYYLTDEHSHLEEYSIQEIEEEYEKSKTWKGIVWKFSSIEDVLSAYNSSDLHVKNRILLRMHEDEKYIVTTTWRAIFNSCLPEMPFVNEKTWSKWLKKVLDTIYDMYWRAQTVSTADDLKDIWFLYATKSSVTINIFDLNLPPEKTKILDTAWDNVNQIHNLRFRWFVSDVEKHKLIIKMRSTAKAKIEKMVKEAYAPGTDIYSLIDSKARWNRWQMTQMAGMKWLVASPSWEIIELPIKSSLLEWFSPIEYFISAHWARKWKADTALRTAESWYLTRRLVDASQEAIIRTEDCGTEDYIIITEWEAKVRNESFESLIFGRVVASDVIDDRWTVLVEKNTLLDKNLCKLILDAWVDTVHVRSPLTCHTVSWVCQKCFGMDLSLRSMVDIWSPVGIISSQSIGEPGTQLTMRTFHSWWVASMDGDMTQGIKRVEELFEVRNPKKPAVITPFDWTAVIVESSKKTEIEITSEPLPVTYVLKEWYDSIVWVWEELAKWWSYASKGRSKLKIKNWWVVLEVHKDHIVLGELKVAKKKVAVGTIIRVKQWAQVYKWQLLTTWGIDIREYMQVIWDLEAQRYIVKEIKKVYTSQGQDVNDKYMETIVKQLFSKVMISDAGNSSLVPGTIVKYEEMLRINKELEEAGKQPARWDRLALWLTQVAKESNSWMSAASFQETIRVMVEASTRWAIDPLDDLKANVIIGRLLPVWKIYQAQYEKEQQKWNILDSVIQEG